MELVLKRVAKYLDHLVFFKTFVTFSSQFSSTTITDLGIKYSNFQSYP
ncbi:hypothetical protein [Mycoplasma parvum]|uniref:Uncharacterized protein n=1 Tax=Mycoplasma parvum str. Indiana TaxID=1403316 RepID=U5NCI5_9MOLU|nr:hypothetical protein [Mycoplasma parvum]AGX89035.1 hypothetical protein PRV_01375 [Mycoplasma parvum str. Indiana]